MTVLHLSRGRRPLAASAVLALAAVMGAPTAASASDPASPAISFTPWNSASIRVAESDRRFVGTFTFRPVKEGQRFRVDASLSAPLDERSREAAFLTNKSLASGFTANLFLGYDSRRTAIDLLNAAEAEAEAAQKDRDAARGTVARAEEGQREAKKRLDEVLNLEATAQGDLSKAAGAIYGAQVTINGETVTIGSEDSAETKPLADVVAEVCAKTPRPRLFYCISPSEMKQVRDDVVRTDSVLADARTKSADARTHLDRAEASLTRALEKRDALAAQVRMNVGLRTGALSVMPQDPGKLPFAWAIGLEVGGHFDQLKLLTEADADAGAAPRKVADWSATAGARADFFLGRQHVITLRVGGGGGRDITDAGTVDQCRTRGPMAGPTVQDCTSVRLVGALDPRGASGYTRLSYTLYGRKVLPEKVEDQDPKREAGGVVPGAEIMVGAEEIGRSPLARVRTTVFVTPTGDPDKVKLAGRFGLGFELLVGSDAVTFTPFGMVGGNF